MNYDYIIAGTGCAGLSLLYRILKEPTLRMKKVLMIDKVQKTSNDRTWCFWEKDEGKFESIVRYQWKTLEFKTEAFTTEFDLIEYEYKMIRGIDFYNFVLELAKKFDNVEFKTEEIKSLDVINNKAILTTYSNKYTSDYLFNSTSLMNPQLSKKNSLLQHFMGWEIKTNNFAFNPKIGTLMDFSLDQKHGATFMYVLPISNNQALIEYTLFTSDLLEKDEYKIELKKYISNYLNIENYDIIEEEYGIIPMSTQTFHPHFKEKIINIGTAGGQTKASSGYTFQFIQKYSDSIIEKLVKDESPVIKFTLRDKMFQWYDRTLLEVIISKKMTGKQIFSMMFKKLPPEKILKFLGNESSVFEDIKIMFSLPTSKFLPAGIKQI